ncbi:MAG: FAD-dependent monooxygenase, partial [Phycisphaerales bacterium]|nr:FAD-dependent monooxygenase [Phycisphaerales bacterium]
HRYADTFGHGRMFIAGDAAHVHVPIGGQGMNTGIQDAFNLGWKLSGVVRGELRPAVLDSYSKERQPVAASLIRGTDFAYRGVLHPGELRQRLARTFGPFVIRSESVQSFMRSTLEEIRIAYADSPLNQRVAGAGPEPGHRLPEAQVVDAATGETTTLHGLCRSGRWLLLAVLGDSDTRSVGDAGRVLSKVATMYPGVENGVIVARLPERLPQPGRTRVLLDPLREAAAALGASAPVLVLVRPDQVIAFVGPMSDDGAVDAYLARVLIPNDSHVEEPSS